MKLAAEKSTLPEPKQAFRLIQDGAATHDVIELAGESAGGQPLLEPVMRDGERLPAGRRSLDETRVHANRALAMLPARVRALEPASPPYAVEISQGLQNAAACTRRWLQQR